MDAAKSILDDLECPICFTEFEDPLFVGQCMHRICKKCLKKLIDPHLNEGEFRCPECRCRCKIPKSRIQGFKSDFKLKSIIQRYQNAQQNKAGTACTVCKSPASHFCRQCDDLYLCPVCGKKHDLNPDTDHVIIGICLEHGKPLAHYCRPCDSAACSACRIAYHSGSSHEVQLHTDVINETIDSFKDTRDNLKRKASDMDVEETRLNDVLRQLDEKVDITIKKIALKTESALTNIYGKCQELSTERARVTDQTAHFVRQIQLCSTRKLSIERKIEALEKQSVQLVKEKLVLRRRLNSKRSHMIGKINNAVEKARKVKEAIQSKMALLDGSRVLESSSVSKLTKLLKDLEKISKKDSETGDSFIDAALEIGEFVQSDVESEIGVIASASKKGREFTWLKSLRKPVFPANRRCVHAYNAIHMQDGRLVVIGSSAVMGTSPTLWVFDAECTRIDNMLNLAEKHDWRPPSDMKFTPTDDLLILREHRPIIVEYEITGKSKDIVQVIQDPLEKRGEGIMKKFARDKVGNFILLCGVRGTEIVVINPNGDVLLTTPVENAYGIAFAHSGDLWVAHRHSVARFKWDGTELHEISAVAVDEALWLIDIAVNDEGEVFVIGAMSQVALVSVHQVMVDDEKGCLKIKKLRFQDQEDRVFAVQGVPHHTRIDVQDTQIALTYNNNVEIFQLGE